MNGSADLLERESILKYLKFNSQQFLSMCVIAGCDYTPNIKTIGIHRAKHFVENGDYINVLKKHKFAPVNYEADFSQGLAVFHHQVIYNVEKLTIEALEPWSRNEDRSSYGPACGEYPLFKNLH